MRTFLIIFFTIFALCIVLVMAVAGKRGSLSRRSPIELFADMVRQPKLRPETPSQFFADGRASRMPVEGTVAREDKFYEDLPANTGHLTGSTNYIEAIPVPVTATLLARGQQRFTINCSPCHGAQGDGNGITKRIGAMAVVTSLHDKRVIELADGEIFHTITYGKNLMGPYGANVTPDDRWAIIAYVRSLQLSRLGSIDDVPEQMRSTLKK